MVSSLPSSVRQQKHLLKILPYFAGSFFMSALRTIQVTTYVTPLREGGSLPAIVEGDDGFLYALKFRGAGQGIKALVAELIGGELARALGFKVPELVFAQVDPAFGRTEPDEEIQDLLKKSTGLNLALHYLSGAFTFDPVVTKLDATTASRIVWLDAYLMNVDRTARNANMLMWQKELWLIDHGAALYFHHAGTPASEAAAKPFVQVKDHVLLPMAAELETADEYCKQMLTPQLLANIVALIPDDWLQDATAEGMNRNLYLEFLTQRLQYSNLFVQQAIHARQALL